MTQAAGAPFDPGAPFTPGGAGASTSSQTRALLTACACALPGLAPLFFSRDPLALCCWLALVAAPLGCVSAACALAAWPWTAMVPALWLVALSLECAGASRVLPTPVWAGAAWSGLFLAGWALGRLDRDAAPRRAASVTLLLLALAALPIGLGLCSGAFSPAITARLLDLAPTSWIVESAGVDWMRHPALYEPARTFDLGPELRAPFRGALAGPALLLVGCGFAWIAARRTRSAAAGS